VQPQKVSVTFVSNIKTPSLLGNNIHDVDIMNLGCGDVKKAGNGSFNIKEGMKFNSSLMLSELCPPEDV
jgi:hypothetical protein